MQGIPRREMICFLAACLVIRPTVVLMAGTYGGRYFEPNSGNWRVMYLINQHG